MLIAIAAGSAAAKLLKGATVVAAVQIFMTLLVGAEAAVSGGTADLINLVIDRGLTFSLAILFITLLITRRVKIVDPTELSALAQISERLKTIDDSLKEIERKVDR